MADNKVLFTLEIQQKGSSVSAVVKETDKLAKSTKNVENAERKRNKTSNTAYTRQKQGIIQTANSTKNFSKLSQSIDGGGGGPGGLVRAYALLAANVFALSAAFNVFSRAAQIDTLIDSMRQLEIVSGKSIMSVARELQVATGYGMNFAESMRSVSLATSAGFDSSQIKELGAVARNAAVSLGRNVPDALDRIFRGVIKVEPELLDEIGLFVRVNDASAKYAAQIGKSVGDLTEFEKRQAFLNEALDQGTSKFAAFAEVENDPFALLATTFADISQAVLSFLNNAIGPTVKFLAENKMIFSIIFGAVAFTLLKMAIPAMGKFTQSMAANAATAHTANQKIISENKMRANLTRQQHKQFLEQEVEKKKALAATARAATQKASPIKLRVRGREKSKSLEAAMEKELTGKARQQVVEQRILDLKKRQGLEQRQQMPGYKEELAALEAESVILKDQLATQSSIKNVKDMGGIDKGSLQDIETIKLHKKAVMSDGLAKVVNTAQTKGFSAAQQQLTVQLQLAEAELLEEGITLSWLDKIMFRATGTAANLGVAFQTMMAKVMPWITAIMMALPLLKGFTKWLGFGGAAATALKESVTELEETMDLLGPRMDHINKQFENFGDDFVAYNKGLESFKETILTTITAIDKAAKALEYYEENTSAFLQHFSWSSIKNRSFGIFFETEAEKIDMAMGNMIKSIEESKFGITGAMEEAIKGFTIIPKMPWVAYIADAEKAAAIEAKWMKDKREAFKAIIEAAEQEAVAVRNVRSAIDGAADSARAFTNAFIVSTDFDKPLSSIKQMNAALDATRVTLTVGEGGEIIKEVSDELLLTDKERLFYAKELNDNQALRALMTKEERTALDAAVKSGGDFSKVLKKVEDRFFRQQQIALRLKSELQEITTVSKIYEKSQKVTGETAERIIRLEKVSSDLKIQEAKARSESARSSTKLTEEQVKQFALSSDLLDFENDALLVGENQAQVQAAISAFKEKELLLLEEAVKMATEQERIDLARAQIALKNLEVVEKINKLDHEKETMQKRIAKFQASGETKLTAAEEIKVMVEAEETRLKTARERMDLEIKISNLQMKVLELELKVMKRRAEEKRQEIADKLGMSVEGTEAFIEKLGYENIMGGLSNDPRLKKLYENFTELNTSVDSITQGIEEVGEASAQAATLIAKTFENAGISFLDKVLGKIKESLPGVDRDPFAGELRNRQAYAEGEKAINKAVLEDKIKLQNAAFEELAKIEADLEAKKITGKEAADEKKKVEAKLKTDIDQVDINAKSGVVNMAINMMETNLLNFADNITQIFGEDGVFVSALATASANILHLGQNFGETFDNAKKGAGQVSVVTAAAASMIGNMISLSAAQAKQQTGEIDKLIEAEEKRDGKSAQSVAKIKALEAKKEAIKRKAFETNKKMMLAQAIMSTAAAISGAMAGPPSYPWSIPFIAAAAAMGAMQINLIKGMTYSGGASSEPTANTALNIGGRGNSVDVSKQVGGGELAYLRQARGVGTNANNFTPGGAVGMKNYSTGMPIMVGEQGPEIITPPVDIIPNEDIGRTTGTTNINFSISAVDGTSVYNMLQNQQGNIISMIREAANDNGERFLEAVDPDVYGEPLGK